MSVDDQKLLISYNLFLVMITFQVIWLTNMTMIDMVIIKLIIYGWKFNFIKIILTVDLEEIKKVYFGSTIF